MSLRDSGQKDDAARFLPKEIPGWKMWGGDEIYDPQTIFQYIDGAGEVYRSYNMRRLVVRHLHEESMPEIVVDFFDMGSAADAFGVFTHDLEGERLEIGQDAVYQSSLLSFWQDRFFVAVSCEEESEEIKSAILETGRWIAQAIGRDGERPGLVSLVPTDRYARDGIRYFHTHHILNYHFFVSNENILKLDAKTEAVLARPSAKGAKERCLIIRYPDAAKAGAAGESFVKTFMPDAALKDVVRTEDGTWTGISIVKEFAILIFHAASENDVNQALTGVENRMRRL